MAKKLIQNAGISGLHGMGQISELAKLLRDEGDTILNGSSKLSLSTDILTNLNEAFALVIDETDDLETSFQVCNSSRNEVIQHIKFLHDFVQKTKGIKISHDNDNLQNSVDISKFRHLKYLELHKVPIKLVKGIQGVRGQIECIICCGGRGVNSLQELLVNCGADNGVGFVWASLTQLGMPYNALINLDKSLEYTPWLTTIELSHNALQSVEELKYLPNIKNVNLSFNNLEAVPRFHKSAQYSMKMLLLKSNYIDNITGLEKLEGLEVLDVSMNVLTDHKNLKCILAMPKLTLLDLRLNPIFYHPHHKMMVLGFLHPRLSDINCTIMLNGEELNRYDQLIISENRSKLSFFLQVNRENCEVGNVDIVTSYSDANIQEPMSSENDDNFDDSATQLNHKKKKYIIEAVIDEDDIGEDIQNKPNSLTNSYLDSSKDHLETKRQILALREKYGEENWLSSHSAACIHSLMGLQSPPVHASSLLSSSIDSELKIASNAQSISPIQISSPSEISEKIKVEVEINGDTLRIQKELESSDEGITIETDAESDVNVKLIKHIEPLEDSGELDEEKGDLYLVQRKLGEEKLEELFLFITEKYIKEKDSLTGKVKCRWAIDTILSCVLGRGTPTTVNINFDTVRKDRNARTYIIELSEAKKIVETLNEAIKNFQPMILKIFKCMKCATHFSQDGDNNVVGSQNIGTTPKCPSCDSKLVIRTDELSTPNSVKNEVVGEMALVESSRDKKPTEKRMQRSSSQCSIGGTEGGANSITTSLVHCESHTQSQCSCSATSLEQESRESTPSIGTVNKKCESDIEILSNPSQSSIEVLEISSKSATPLKKKVSEEKRKNVASISDISLVMTGLTESSSSGSLTDSVCTAYEPKISKLADVNEMSSSRSDAETLHSESTFAPVSNLTTRLGELLQSMKIGSSKDNTPKLDESSEFVGSSIQYSYTDFNNIDHRIKLHIILNIFEHENEEIAFLLRADILTQTSTEVFPGCLVMSTAKVYVLRITGPEGEDPQRWLNKDTSWGISRLRSFGPLPFKQGILVELEQPGESNNKNVVLCILQDLQRTSNFLLYLTDSSIPSSCDVEFIVPEYCNNCLKDILKLSKNHEENDAIRLFSIFSSATLKRSNDSINIKLSSLIITSSNLIIMQDKVDWLLCENNKLPNILAEQAMSNLLEVELGSNILTLNFLDEVACTDATWIIELVSSNAAEAIINSIRPPWEELFSVPLQINTPLRVECEDSQEFT